jgi:endoplasmic reticulum Man9GlcNAc2 1,2-alpha-mannosidase
MNLTSEFKEARMFVKNRLSLQPDNGRVNLFECTIRVLGGFISTYYLTGYVLTSEFLVKKFFWKFFALN